MSIKRCPNYGNISHPQDHQWFPRLIIFGIPIMKKCHHCGARKVLS